MTDQDPGADSSSKYGGDRRAKDRRKNDRRGDNRRGPLPPWRRPIAFVGYGVLTALILVFVLRGLGGDEAPTAAVGGTEDAALVAADRLPRSTVSEANRTALTLADFEALVAEGDAAVGQVVEAELYCGSIGPVTLMQLSEVDSRLLAVADAEGQVPGAECRWSQDSRSSDFLLVVPPQHAEEFARAPEVELNFVRRRRVPVNLVWLGRSEGLALRIAGVLTEIRGTDR